MPTYHPELLARRVPRYTSYPTANLFHGGIGADAMASALDSLPADAELSLYVHIPYCTEICWYCGCNTGAANRRQRLGAYLESLADEIGLVAARLGGRGRVRRIAFGGGSPNAIDALDFVRLVDRLVTSFSAEAPLMSVELDPRALTPGWIAAMAAAGVRRASLGVQTFAPHVQQAIGRIQPEQLVEATVHELRARGVSSLNFDLMYGLPGQTPDDLEATLSSAVRMGADRIALFDYAHVPQLIPRQRRIDATRLPGAEERFRQAELGRARLVSHGYRPIGFDHFARPEDPVAIAACQGRLHRDFQGFTDDASEHLIGLGASAISRFPDRLIQNEKNAGRYRMLVSAGRLPAVRGIARDREDQRRGRVIESLLCHGQADVSGLCLGRVMARLEPFRAQGLVSLHGRSLCLAPDALPYARAIAATFDLHLDPVEQRFSNAI